MFENLSHQHYKIENTRFSQVTFSWSYLQKMPLKHKTFHGKTLLVKQLRDCRESLCLNFVFSCFALTHFHGKSLVESFLRKCLWRSFWRKTWKMQLEQKLKHKSIKTLSKTYKILKIFLGLIDKQLSIHITFDHVQSHKWIKHSLNKSLVSCVWVLTVE